MTKMNHYDKYFRKLPSCVERMKKNTIFIYSHIYNRWNLPAYQRTIILTEQRFIGIYLIDGWTKPL